MTTQEGVNEMTLTFHVPAFSARIGDVEVTVAENGIVRVNDEPIFLTHSEQAFLLLLAQGRGQVRTPGMLFAGLYSGVLSVDLKILDVFACKIRSKLGNFHETAASVVKTVWGRGYAFGSPAVEPVAAPQGFPSPEDRWVPSRKAHVITAIRRGSVSQDDVLTFYPDLSAQELIEWLQIFELFGQAGLRSTRTLAYLQARAA